MFEFAGIWDARGTRTATPCYPIGTRINQVANDDEARSTRVELAQIQNRIFY